ncbi:tRNA glutamyl-Q(34) synthetase GluQRS [Sphingomonas tabacisoli]|uniref:tRNA glutamyl-Q(34) synthetase GluQRS n=1 Tax=Sphingomonas tabacisoli TaxID=2249466 RepID=A0ABW4HZN8_9SPHN
MSLDLSTTRFAPSPTGRLHLGHAMSAVLSHDFARARGGRFLLRIEDIDPGRTREEFVGGIEEDLRWLGLDWDGPVVRQSERLPLYAEALERLRARDLVYPCFCTRADIARSAAAPHGPEGPLYPGTCRGLADPDLSRPHAWRLDVAKATALTGPLEWHDEHAGAIVAQPELLGDVVLARKDAPTSYHVAVTVDDAAQGVTDVIRGQDLFLSTHVHRLLQALLDLPTPSYHHHPLILDANGERLAKRHGALSLADLRAEGVDPREIVSAFRDGRAPLGFRLSGV